jgi:hypothetical protein
MSRKGGETWGTPRAELDYSAGGRIVITRMSISLIGARPIAPQDDGPVLSIWSPGFSVSSRSSSTIRRKCLPRLIGALRQFQAGTEISEIPGFTVLRLLEIKIDYRDGRRLPLRSQALDPFLNRRCGIGAPGQTVSHWEYLGQGSGGVPLRTVISNYLSIEMRTDERHRTGKPHTSLPRPATASPLPVRARTQHGSPARL